MLGAGALSLKKRKKQLFLLYAKITGLYKNVHWQATDDTERDDIKRIFGKHSKVYLVRNIPDEIKKYVPRKKGITKYIFLSRISEKKNLLYAINLFKDIKNKDVVFSIYGTSEDFKYLEKCKKEALNFPDNIKVEFMGEIEHDKIHNLLSEYHFFLLPTMHENFGHSIFEALAAGCPVLISDQTPWRNLEDENAGWDLPLQNVYEWIGKFRELAEMDDSEYQKWSRGARRLAEEYVNSSELLEGYRGMFDV
jgi:glycosyltransferase involved in cell wall biosynthesis